MKAALTRPGGKLEYTDCDDPSPAAGELLIKISYCGICGSDLHMLQAGLLRPGAIIGHELSGHIEKVGQAVQGFEMGEQVVALPFNPCRECEPCKQGNTQICSGGLKRSYGLGGKPGAFSQYMTVTPSMLFKIPHKLDLKTAALNEPWAVAVHGMNVLDPHPDSLAMIMGAGPIGLLSVYALKRLNIDNIYVSEPDVFRRERALAAGAKVIDPADGNPATIIKKSKGWAPDCVIDCAGTASSIQEAVNFSGPHGKVLVLGVHMGNASLLPITCFGKEIQINFSFGYTYKEFSESLELLDQGAIDPDLIISGVMPLSRIEQAFEQLHQPGHAKILIDCQA